MLDITAINNIPLQSTVTDELAVMAADVISQYCTEHESCCKCVFHDGDCRIIFRGAPQIWKDRMMNTFLGGHNG